MLMHTHIVVHHVMCVCTGEHIPCEDVSTTDTSNDVFKMRDNVDIHVGKALVM